MPTPVSSGALRTAATCLLLLSLSALVACGDDDPTGSEDSVLGTWEFSDLDGQHYYHITDSTFTSFHQSLLGADCFTIREWEIIDIDGSEYTIRDSENPGVELTIDIERDGSRLLLLATSMDRADIDIDDLDECTASLCEGLPTLTADDFVSGSLTATDEIAGGRRYDAYAITGIDGFLTLHMTSTELDPFLRLLSETGGVIAENDDMDETTLNAFIEAGFGASSCTVVVATTSGADDLGTYILNVEPQM